MSEASHATLRAIWRQLAQRNDWALVDDEAAFLEQAAREYHVLSDARPPGERQRAAVHRAYGALLYQGLVQRQQRPAEELWIAFVRTAVGRGWSQAAAEELAQEGIARVIENLPSLRAPQSLFAWAFQIFRTVRRDGAKQNDGEQSLDANDGEVVHQPADIVDIVAQVEERIASQELLALLRTRLPNPLERLVAMRIALFDHRPRVIAKDLGLPPARVRVARSRALQRLRADADFMRYLEDNAR